MARYRWHEHPSGVMWRFKEYRYPEMTSVAAMYKLKKEDFLKLVNPDWYGRKRKQTATAANARLIRLFWKKAIDRMMESDRMIIDDDHSMYIGRIDPDKNLLAGAPIPQTMTHGIILNGFFHNYYFRMPQRRRDELRARIKKGQSFIT